jgi:CelD/BcsL family acetyltransferase involved in cellulose biosynthesis
MQDAAISAVDGPDALSVELLTTVADFDGLAGAWQTLECQVTSPAFFQSFAWCRFVAHARQATESGDAFQPRVIVVRSEGEVALIWPLAIVKSAAGRVVEDLTEPFGQYSDALVAPRANADALLDAAWAEIKRWRVDALMLQRVRSDAGIASWLGRNAHRVGQTREAPFVALSAFEDFAAYHRSIRAKTRKNLRNYRNRLARDGEVTHRVITDPDDIRDLTELCLLWRTDWLTASGLSSAAFQHCAFERIIDGLAKGTHGAPPLQMMTLTLNQKNAPPDQADGDSADASHAPRIVTIQWGFRFRNRYYAFMSAKNQAFDAFSPGRLHLEDVIEACAQDGIDTVDLLVPRMPYKDTWATGAVDVSGFGLATSLRGTLIVDVWHKSLRPKLKWVVMKLPTPLRRALFAETSHRHDATEAASRPMRD